MPDGLFLAEGDVEAIRMNRLPQYQSYTAGIIAANIASNFYKNPYLKKEVIRLTSGYQQRVDWLNYFLFNDHDLQPRAISELPLTKYFGSPNGTMIARTGWNLGLDAPDVIAFMKIYEQTGDPITMRMPDNSKFITKEFWPMTPASTTVSTRRID
jgi:heparin/heparan-sulfate lyase